MEQEYFLEATITEAGIYSEFETEDNFNYNDVFQEAHIVLFSSIEGDDNKSSGDELHRIRILSDFQDDGLKGKPNKNNKNNDDCQEKRCSEVDGDSKSNDVDDFGAETTTEFVLRFPLREDAENEAHLNLKTSRDSPASDEQDSDQDKLLAGILKNVEKLDDPVTSGAWVETLLEISDVLPSEAIRKQILPVALSKAQLYETQSSRLSATLLFAKLAEKLDPHTNRTEVIPCIQSLCQDVDPQVRAGMCRQLPLIAKSYNVREWQSSLFPMLIELSNDSEVMVFEATIECILGLLNILDNAARVDIIIPLVKSSCDRSLSLIGRNDSVTVIAKQYGRLCSDLSDNMSDDDRSWFVQFFCRLAGLSSGSSGIVESGAGTNSDPMSGNTLHNLSTVCRQYCAFNFPAMLLFAKTSLFKFKLLPIFNKLCQDPDATTRRAIAAGFHEICKLLDDEAFLITEHFIEFVRVGDVEVLDALAEHLSETLERLYKSGPMVDSNGNVMGNNVSSDRPKNPNASNITTCILFWISSLKGSPNWRSQHLILCRLSCLVRCLPSDELFAKIVPVLFDEILTQRALPCRHAALESLLRILRHIKRQQQRQFILNRLKDELCLGNSCHKRLLYLDGSQFALNIFSRSFFKQHFIDSVLAMINDKVLSVRLRLCRLLPKLRAVLSLPGDSDRLNRIESVVKHMLASERTPHGRETLQQVINELDAMNRSDSTIADMENRGKEEEELALFGRELRDKQQQIVQIAPMPRSGPPPMAPEIIAINGHDKENSTSHIPRVQYGTLPPSSRNRHSFDSYSSRSATLDSRIRNHATKTAIVRPHQIVTRSPSPIPSLDKEQLYRDKEYANGYHQSVEEPLKSQSRSRSSSGTPVFMDPVKSSAMPGTKMDYSSISSNNNNNSSLPSIGQSLKNGLYKEISTNPNFSRLTHSSSTSSVPVLVRPATPVITRRGFGLENGHIDRDEPDSGPPPKLHNHNVTSSIMTRSMPEPMVATTSQTGISQVGRRSRLVPIVRHGNVKESIQRFQPELQTASNGYVPMTSSESIHMNGNLGSHITKTMINGDSAAPSENNNSRGKYPVREMSGIPYVRLSDPNNNRANNRNTSSTYHYRTLPSESKDRDRERSGSVPVADYLRPIVSDSGTSMRPHSPLMKVRSASNLPQRIPQPPIIQTQIVWRRAQTPVLKS